MEQMKAMADAKAAPLLEKLKSEPENAKLLVQVAALYNSTHQFKDAANDYNKALTYDSTKADTLFNLGIVKWQGKKDGPGAVAAWKKLLETNPAYPEKDAALQWMAQAQQR